MGWQEKIDERCGASVEIFDEPDRHFLRSPRKSGLPDLQYPRIATSGLPDLRYPRIATSGLPDLHP